VNRTRAILPGAARGVSPERMIAFAGLRPEGAIQDAKA
jgi:hypothetical protein